MSAHVPAPDHESAAPSIPRVTPRVVAPVPPDDVVRMAADMVRADLVVSNKPIGLFQCECGRPRCRLTVPLTPAEYDAIRPRRIVAKVHRT